MSEIENKQNNTKEVEEVKSQSEEKNDLDTINNNDVTKQEKKISATREQMLKLRKHVPVGPGNFWNNMLSTVLLLIFITAAFSYLTDTGVKSTELSISEVVAQVKNGEVKEIIV